jgi:hypothetical protein
MSHTPPTDTHSTHAHDGHDTAETEVTAPPKPVSNKIAMVLTIALLFAVGGWYRSCQEAARLETFINRAPPTWMKDGKPVPYSDNCPPAAAPAARPDADASTTTPKAAAP